MNRGEREGRRCSSHLLRAKWVIFSAQGRGEGGKWPPLELAHPLPTRPPARKSHKASKCDSTTSY